MPGASVADQLIINNGLIRKHGMQFMAIADYSTPMPASFFEFDTTTKAGFIKALPVVLAAGFKQMGLITTDGFTKAADVSTQTTMAVQSLEPQRNDVESIGRTLAVTFQEASSYTKALAHNLPVSDWPATRSKSWGFADGNTVALPYYRVICFTQDGVGDDAVYSVDAAYKAQVTAMGDNVKNRTAADETNRTFTLFRDDLIGRTAWEQSEPAIRAAA